MFGSSRRRQPPAQPLTRETANPNAATAAAAVFMSRCDSNASLSSAAAAAALRARPMTPTNVAEGSIDSKSSLLQTQPFRTASQKLKDGTQPSWFGGANKRDANPRTADAVIHSSTYVPEPRSGSVSPSINFSYPRAMALSNSSSVDDITLVYDPNSRRMVARENLVGLPERVREVAEKPKKNKKKNSNLSRGTVSGRAIAPVLEKNPSPNHNFQPQPASEPESSNGHEQEQASGYNMIAANGIIIPEATSEKERRRRRKKTKSKQQHLPIAMEVSDIYNQFVAEEQQTSQNPAFIQNPSVTEEESDGEKLQEQRGKPKEIGSASASAITISPVVPKTPLTTYSEPKPKHRQARAQSESPARSARFVASPSDQLIVKHEPPARSVSPKKSALKLAANVRGVSPSDDGSEPSISRDLCVNGNADATLARKKSVRVSWDDRNTIVVGEAAQFQESDSPMIPSPQTKKPWHNVVSRFGKKEYVTVAEDETMTPRPALPQFGSVREKKVREPEERPLTREPLLAAIPSIENKSQQNSIPESSDDDLDTDVTTEPEDGMETTIMPQTKAIPTMPSTPTKTVPARVKTDKAVPIISISQPSPPALGSSNSSPPGCFPDDEGATVDKQDNEDESNNESRMSTPTRNVEPTNVGVGMADIAEEDEDFENDCFSDAYEDLEDVDGDGFLSLDAVVDSPTFTNMTNKKSDENLIVAKNMDQIEQALPSAISAGEANDKTGDGWENAKAYWKSLSVEKRRQLEIEALSDTGEEASISKKIVQMDQAATAPALATDRSYAIKPGTKWSANCGSDEESELDTHQPTNRASFVAAKTTATANPTVPAERKMRTSIRQSMRSEPPGLARDTGLERPGGMRKSMRNGNATRTSGATQRPAEAPISQPMSVAVSPVTPGQPLRSPTLLKSGRPASNHQHATTGLLKSHKRNMSSDDLRSTTIKPTLRRRGSDDSESSFKRKRAGSASSDTHHFRMSMRSSIREPLSPTDSTKRFSLRSLSPQGFRRNSFSSLPSENMPFLGGPSGRMRQSLRDRPISSSSRLKMGGFTRSSEFGKKSRGGSRFADSSGEEDASPSLFRSRFVDSSDDEEPEVSPKVKSLPRSLRNGNASPSNSPSRSMELSEFPEDDGGVAQPKRGVLTTGKSSVQRSRSGRGTLKPLPQNDVIRPTSRRGSFMSILRRKKDMSDKVSKDISESAARKDTVLERSPEEIAQLRNNALHRRDSSWPLPDEKDSDGETGRSKEPSRPSTAGGVSTVKRSSFLRRRNTSQGVIGLDHVEIDTNEPVPPITTDLTQNGFQRPQQAKKKKFGVLRKMFGIHD